MTFPGLFQHDGLQRDKKLPQEPAYRDKIRNARAVSTTNFTNLVCFIYHTSYYSSNHSNHIYHSFCRLCRPIVIVVALLLLIITFSFVAILSHITPWYAGMQRDRQYRTMYFRAYFISSTRSPLSA